MKLIFKTDLNKYQDYILTPNLLEFFIFIIVFFSFAYIILKRKNIEKIIIVNIIIVVIYSFGEYIRGDVTLKDYILNKNYFTVEGKIQKYKKGIGNGVDIKEYYINNEKFETYILKNSGFNGDALENNPFYKEYYYDKNQAIKGNNQYIKVQYIKIPSWKLCTPFINKCIYGKDKDNKIIKLWVKPYK